MSTRLSSRSQPKTSAPIAVRCVCRWRPTKPLTPVMSARTSEVLAEEVVDPDNAVRTFVPRVPVDLRSTSGDQRVAPRGVIEQLCQRGGEPVAIAGLHELGGLAEHAGQRPRSSGHDRYAGGHRLERSEAEALVARGIGEHRRAGQQVDPGLIIDEPEPHDPLAVPGPLPRGLEGLDAPAVLSGD